MVGSIEAPPERAATAVDRLTRRLAAANLHIPLRLWDGRAVGPATSEFRLVLKQPWSLRALLLPPSDLRVGETYLADGVDVEGSMVAALRAIDALRREASARTRLELLSTAVRLPTPPKGLGTGRVRLAGRQHTPGRDAAAIRHHYDVSNDFYRLLLDRDLVYSCAYFSEADQNRAVADRSVLDRAQRRKLELVCRKLRLRPGEQLLDVGCGWGSLAIHAARHHGVRAVGVTLSEEQASLARERVASAGLREQVEIRLVDYRDVHERFDAIASVGMVEHVGADQLPGYARHLFALLREQGRLLNHGITTGGRDVIRDFAADPNSFIGRYVFPDGALVPAHHMVRVLEREGFEIWDVEQLRPHYARTLLHWVTNLEASYDEARTMVGESTARIWRAYLAGAVLGFESNDLGVVQILATRGPGDLPFGRAHQHLSAWESQAA